MKNKEIIKLLNDDWKLIVKSIPKKRYRKELGWFKLLLNKITRKEYLNYEHYWERTYYE